MFIFKAEEPEERPNVLDCLKETHRTLDYFMNNKFQESLDLMEPWAHCSPYHSLGKATICFIQCLLSFDPDDILHTAAVLKQSVNVCNRSRKKGTLLYISRLLRGVDYNLYTDEEVHAELCYAECLLMNALLTFVSDNSFVNFIKGGLRIRACFRAYKEAEQILENRTWHNEEEKRHFESGVKMGLGIFYLVVAHLPTRITRVLEMIGFCGDKELGLRHMYESVSLDGSLRAPLTALFYLCYNCIITYLFGLADGDLVSSELVVKNMLRIYPRSALFLFFYGRLLEVKGEIDQAIVWLNDSLTVQDKWSQMKNLGSWEIMWCYSFKFDWRSAEKHLDFLRKENRWSPAIYTYVYSLALYMRYLEEPGEKNPKVLEEIEDLMKKVPGLKQRLAGKSFPLEKFAVAKSKKFLDQKNRLYLPFIEAMYITNSFAMFRDKPDILKSILQYIDARLPPVPSGEDPTVEVVEDHCLALLLKGTCFKSAGRLDEATEAFNEILEWEDVMEVDIYLATYAMAELGYMALDRGDGDEAMHWFQQSCHSHTDYHLESFLHYRIHASIKQIQDMGFSAQQNGSRRSSRSSTIKLTPVTPNGDLKNDTTSTLYDMACAPRADDNQQRLFETNHQVVTT